jgi:hypothetical protein
MRIIKPRTADYVYLRNSLHGTEITLRVKRGATSISKGQMAKARKALCPDGCGCGDDAVGQRGGWSERCYVSHDGTFTRGPARDICVSVGVGSQQGYAHVGKLFRGHWIVYERNHEFGRRALMGEALALAAAEAYRKQSEGAA